MLLSGTRLVIQKEDQIEILDYTKSPPMAGVPYIVGALIGFLSGLVGIGGGIFLAPVLYFINWGTPRRIAAACSLFILANSISGLAGQMMKLDDVSLLSESFKYWPLLIAVLFGGQIGSWATSNLLRPVIIKRLTSVLVLYVAARLLYRWATLNGWI